jgi:methyl-accepting chemotaxis protein
MDQVVQQNAALVEEAAAAAENLATQADAMAVTVRHFRLGQEAAPANEPLPTAPAKVAVVAQPSDRRPPAAAATVATTASTGAVARKPAVEEEWQEF